jgi:hypothetical protein
MGSPSAGPGYEDHAFAVLTMSPPPAEAYRPALRRAIGLYRISPGFTGCRAQAKPHLSVKMSTEGVRHPRRARANRPARGRQPTLGGFAMKNLSLSLSAVNDFAA